MNKNLISACLLSAVILLAAVYIYRKRENFCGFTQKYPPVADKGMRPWCPSGCHYNFSTKTCDGQCY